MAINTFTEKVTKYLDILDKLYEQGSKTAILDDPILANKFVGTNKIKLPKVSVSGAANYNRDNGYVQGSASTQYTEYELKYDRGRKFRIDFIDNDEAGAFELYRQVASEFVRLKEVPEIDSIRFAEIYAAATRESTLGAVAEKDLTSSDSILKLFDEAEETLNEKGVPEENRIFFCTNEVYKMLKQDPELSRRIDVTTNNGNINRRVTMLDGQTQIITVPKNRFNTLIQLNDGESLGQEDGGYKTIAGNKPINFIYAYKPALKGVIKRNNSKIIMPGVNQFADAFDIFYRAHHDLIVTDSQTAGIYVHTKKTAQV